MFGVDGFRLAGVFVAVSFLGFQWTEARSGEDGDAPEHCPSAASLVPDFNAAQLARSGLFCHELGFDYEAFELIMASDIRTALDRRFFVPSDPDVVGLGDPVAELRSRLRAVTPELLELDASRIESALARLMDMKPGIPAGYDPGWEYSELPNEAAYHSEHELLVADLYASLVPAMQLAKDSQGSELLRRTEELRGEGDSLGDADREKAHELFNGLKARIQELEGAREDYIVPNLVVGRIDSFGIYDSVGEVEVLDAADTVDGSKLITRVEHVEESTIVPAETGVAFGYDFQIAGIIEGTGHLLKMRAIHPPIRNVKGELQTVSTANFEAAGFPGSRYYDSITYSFNSDYHLIPGEWTLQVLYGEDVILSRSFEVVEVED